MALRRLVFAAIALAVAGCASLPASGPSGGEIKSDTNRFDYELINVDQAVLGALQGRRDETFAGSFGGRNAGASELIGVGDVVRVTVWEAANGGLFSGAAGELGGGSKSTAIPDQPVARNGTISIPYAGRIQAAGRTSDDVGASIVDALAGKAIEPQVLVTVSRSLSNTATVAGAVNGSGRIPLSTAGDRVLDVIAQAGGVSQPVHELFVQLSRGKRTVRVPLQRIVDDPEENVTVRAADTITVIHEPQTFTAFGATGANAEVKFSALGMSLSEALGRVGGLLDSRADPANVFVFRTEKRELVAAIHPASPLLASHGAEIPVIYHFDMRDPKGIFLAREFQIYNEDVLYVADSPLNQLQKFVLLLNAAITPVRQGISIDNSIR